MSQKASETSTVAESGTDDETRWSLVGEALSERAGGIPNVVVMSLSRLSSESNDWHSCTF